MEYIYEHYVESYDGSSDEEDYIDETWMMEVVLAAAEHAEEHVLKFKVSMKAHCVLNCKWAHGHLMLMDDYFFPNVLFVDNFRRRFQMRKNVFDRLDQEI
ncbi:putative glutathione S-transferase GSTU6 [Hordeum vulgare]|nr:putative glutathione S-transferase GSTU6 [Hordeum vulgare]